MKNVKPNHTRPVVCLDAGHYGKYNRSPANSAYYESEMNWKLHLLIKKYLEEYGIEVVLSRADQTKDLRLHERGTSSQNSDLFLSIHSNAVGSRVDDTVDYVAVYHLTNDTTTTVDDMSKEFAKLIAPVIAEVMGAKQGSRTLTRLSSSDLNSDGMMNDNYYGVLNGARYVNTPGLILEHSFHTNTRITNWLLEDANLDKLAKAEAEVIAKWFDVQKKPEIVPEVTPEVTPSATIKEGDVVKIAPDAVYYNGKSVPTWVKNQNWVVKKDPVGDRAVIDKNESGTHSINSPIHVKYLTVVKSKQPQVQTEPKVEVEVKPEVKVPFVVRVSISDLNIRTGPSTSYDVIKCIPKGAYTIVEVQGDWGRLKTRYRHNGKSVDGWIHLSYTTKI